MKVFHSLILLSLISCSKTEQPAGKKVTDQVVTGDVRAPIDSTALVNAMVDMDSLLISIPDLEKTISRFQRIGTNLLERSYGAGDCYGTFMVLQIDFDTLVIDKYQCGEYGFGNNQYLLKGDSLKIVREYKLEWNNDDSVNGFKITEQILYFDFNKLKKKKGIRVANDMRDFSRMGVPFEESVFIMPEEYEMYRREIHELMDREKGD